MSRWSLFVAVLGCLCLVRVGFAPGCGGKKGDNGFGNPGDDGGGGSSGGSGGGGSNGGSGCGLAGCGDGGEVEPTSDGGCTNLQCRSTRAAAATRRTQETTLRGQVLDPAGRNPLYNVVVYVPNSQDGALDPIPHRRQLHLVLVRTRSSRASPSSYALTDADGKFTLTNVPDGTDIPLVVQIGKWRKEITVPKVTACTSNDSGHDRPARRT